MKKIFLLTLISASLLVSCNKEKEEDPTNEGTNPTSPYKLIDKDTTDTDLIVELFAKTSTIDMGYTPLYLKVKDFGGTTIENANVSFLPIMDMGSMKHSSPMEQPVFNSSSKMYEGMAVFTMSSDHGEWELNTIIDGDTTSLDINVLNNPTGTKYVGSYSGTDGEKYIVSLVKPFDWSVGMNDVSVMVHKKETMMSFPAVDDFTIVMDPQMTSMGHGSPNNVSPSSIGNGYYKGKVNFTMTGDWRLNLDLIKASDTIVKAEIDILF